MRIRNAPLQRLFETISIAELARRLGLTLAAVSYWDEVPRRHVQRVAEITALPRHVLRPDLFAADDAMVLAAQRSGRQFGLDLSPDAARAIALAVLDQRKAA